MFTRENFSYGIARFLIGVSFSTSASLLAGRGTGQDNRQIGLSGLCCRGQVSTVINKVILRCLFAIKSHCNLLTEMEVDVIRVIKQRRGGSMDVTRQVSPLHWAQPVLQRRKAQQWVFSNFSRYFKLNKVAILGKKSH